MSSQNVSQLKDDLERMSASLNQTKRELLQQAKMMEQISQHCAGEIARLEKEPASPSQARLLTMQQVRRRLANTCMEMAKLVLTFDPNQLDSVKAFNANQPRLNTLKVEGRFLALDFALLNYVPVAAAIEAALQGPSTASGPSGHTAPLGARTGGLSTGRLASNTPPRPATGPLSQRAAATGGTGPLSQRAAAAGTGPLSQRAAAAGTGPMSLRGEAPARDLASQLLPLVQQPASRTLLEQLLVHYQDVQTSFAPLRGAEPGTLAVTAAEAEVALNKLAGKVYYLNRAVQQLGPSGACVAFESEGVDTHIELFLAKPAVAALGDGEASPARSLTGLFKSLLGGNNK